MAGRDIPVISRAGAPQIGDRMQSADSGPAETVHAPNFAKMVSRDQRASAKTARATDLVRFVITPLCGFEC
jgi:hypothetical protein